MPSTSAPRTTISILPLSAEKLDMWMDANIAVRGVQEVQRLARFWDETQTGIRTILAAWQGDEFLGHVTVQYQSQYQPFRRRNIVEIVDLWVQPAHRRRGIARYLLLEAEDHAGDRATMIGLGVGITEDFGPAHRLYAGMDYRPDGTGVWAQGQQIKDGDRITVDDAVLLMWIKDL